MHGRMAADYIKDILAKPAPELVNRDVMREMFKKESQTFIAFEKRKIETIYKKTLQFNESIQAFLHKQKKIDSYEVLLKLLAEKYERMCFRLYICNEEGYQVSPNILKRNGEWVLQHDYLNKNWSWRPYFLENIIRMRNEKKGILSDLYSDIETRETIRTFSYPIVGGIYLFIDFAYEYLYENEDLL